MCLLTDKTGDVYHIGLCGLVQCATRKQIQACLDSHGYAILLLSTLTIDCFFEQGAYV